MLSLFLRNSRRARLTETSYLDGLRGVASLIVYFHHHTIWTHGPQGPLLESSFGHSSQHHFATLPLIRLFFSGGHFAVITFLVLSGYVLSYRPLQLIRSNDRAKLLDMLASATFRRWLRLYLPVAATSFIVMTLTWMTGWKAGGPPLEVTYFAALSVWTREMINFSFPFAMSRQMLPNNSHLWSIPLEMKGSMLVYGTALATSRMPDVSRLIILGSVTWYLIYVIGGGWYLAAFTLGMTVCQLDLVAQDRRETGGTVRKVWKQKPHLAMLVIGLLLGGVPHVWTAAELAANPGWYYLAFLKPSVLANATWFYLLAAATLLVSSVSGLPRAQRFLGSNFCQYLGRISYGLYLCHGYLLWSVGDMWYKACQRNIQFGAGSWPLGLEPWYILTELFMLPLTLVVAEAVTLYIDQPSVRFAKYVYALAQGGDKQQSTRWVV